MKHETILCDVYDRYIAKENLPRMSADDLYFEQNLTDNQRNWLDRFSNLWEKLTPTY